MTNKSPRSQNGKRPRLRLLDLNFSGNVNEVLSNGRRPHGGLRGSKKHPLSPYSFNKDEKHHQQVKEAIDRQFDEDFVDRHGSPAWVTEANKEISHSGENPLFINRLLSPCKLDNDSSFIGSRAATPSPSGRLPGTPKRGGSLYYRQTTPHQYLSATELPVVSQTDPTPPILGRPTRTTLLRARQRCNSAPINAYQKRREGAVKLPSGTPSISREQTSISLSIEGETNHAFLTGARYNRARLMDVKSLNVYGVYMPRGNPLECFMTGPAMSRLRDRNEESPGAPPDTPRSDIDDATEDKDKEKEVKPKRPSTAPSKRLLSSTSPSGGRPRSARNGNTSPSINFLKDESENKENLNNNLIEKLIILQNGLFITGRGVIVTLKGFKTPPPQKKESILPSVTGISVPKMTYKKSRSITDDTASIKQPPPTPVGQLSVKDETEQPHHPEIPKSPIPEETGDEKLEDGQTQNKETIDEEEKSKNMEMTVKIIQLSSVPSETVVVYDKAETGASNEAGSTKDNVLKELKTECNTSNEKPDDGIKLPSIHPKEGENTSLEDAININTNENEKENNVNGNTFITEEERTTDVKNVLSIPNAKIGPDIA